MKREFAGLTPYVAAVVLGLSVGGCAKEQKKPVAEPAPTTGTAWKLRLNSTCAEDASEKCTAGYGFTVLADGRFQVGPGPEGQLFSGYLKSAEMKPIVDAIARLESAVGPEFEQAETCKERAAAGAGEDAVTLNRFGREKLVARASAKEFCHRLPSEKDAEALHKAIRELASNHYPLPFPDACINAALSVEKAYAPLQECHQDADCAYIDVNFLPIPAGDIQQVTVDDCTLVRPMAVGNAGRITEEQQSALLSARLQARAACGSRITRLHCGEGLGFQADSAPAPRCVQGSCRIPDEVRF